MAEFNELCRALWRNDPTVTSVNVHYETAPLGYGRRLGDALLQGSNNYNTVVSSLTLYLTKLATSADRAARTTDSVESLLCWMQQSPSSSSLHTVKLHTLFHEQSDQQHVQYELVLLDKIVHALTQNPGGIRVFESHLSHFPLSLWATFLTANTQLQSLTLAVRGNGDDVTTKMHWQCVARAIQALSALKVLSLRLEDGFESLLQHLQSHDSLRQLTVTFYNVDASMELLCGLMRNCIALKRVEFAALHLQLDQWRLLSAALAANPNIATLALVRHCSLSQQAADAFWNDFYSTGIATSQPQVRRLHLDRCNLHLNGARLGEMLCLHASCRIRHVTLDCCYWSSMDVAHFCHTLANKNGSFLRSITLNRMPPYILQCVAGLVAKTVHLRRLVVAFKWKGSIKREELSAFLSKLRLNGSLRMVKVALNPCSDNDGSALLSRRACRYIKAVTRRNRLEPRLLRKCARAHAAAAALNASTDVTTRAYEHDQDSSVDYVSPQRLPLLALGAMHAGQTTAATTLLKTLQSMPDGAPGSSMAYQKGKRVRHDTNFIDPGISPVLQHPLPGHFPSLTTMTR